MSSGTRRLTESSRHEPFQLDSIQFYSIRLIAKSWAGPRQQVELSSCSLDSCELLIDLFFFFVFCIEISYDINIYIYELYSHL